MSGRLFGVLAGLALLIGAAFAAPPYVPRSLAYDPARLHSYSDLELIDLMSTGSFEANSEPAGTKRHFWDVAAGELVARRATKALLKAFAETDDHFQLYPITDALNRIHDPAADKVLHRYLTRGLDDTNRVAAEYFGKRCEPKALAILNRNFRRYAISSLEAGSIATIFGNCRYRPAARQLAEAVDAASLNLASDAHAALNKIFPEAGFQVCDTSKQCAARWQLYVAQHKAAN